MEVRMLKKETLVTFRKKKNPLTSEMPRKKPTKSEET